MAAEHRSRRNWGDSEEALASPEPVPRGRLWILIPAACGCAVVGCLLAAGAWRDLFLTDGPRPEAPPPAAAPAPENPAAVKTARDAPRPAPEQLVAEAKQLAQQLSTALPDNPQALVLAGRIFYAFNDTSRADDCWQACLTRKPGFAEAQCAIAEAAWEHGDFDRAAGLWSEVLAGNPRLDQKQVFFLADALMNLGRAPEAVAVLEQSAQHHALPPFGLFLLGQAHLESDQYEAARRHFEAVLAANPESANAHFGLATVYTRLGDPAKAGEHREQYAKLRKEELAESARLRPEMRKADWADPIPVVRESYLNAGKVFAALNRLDETERLWLRAAELDPQNPRPRELLDLLHADREARRGRGG